VPQASSSRLRSRTIRRGRTTVIRRKRNGGSGCRVTPAVKPGTRLYADQEHEHATPRTSHRSSRRGGLLVRRVPRQVDCDHPSLWTLARLSRPCPAAQRGLRARHRRACLVDPAHRSGCLRTGSLNHRVRSRSGHLKHW